MKLNYQSWNLLSERKREKGWNYSIRKIEGKQPREIINLRIEFRGRSLSDIYTSSRGFLRGRFVPSNYTCTVESPRTFARGGQDKRGVRGPINGRRHALDSLPPGSPLAWVPCANVYIRGRGWIESVKDWCKSARGGGGRSSSILLAGQARIKHLLVARIARVLSFNRLVYTVHTAPALFATGNRNIFTADRAPEIAHLVIDGYAYSLSFPPYLSFFCTHSVGGVNGIPGNNDPFSFVCRFPSFETIFSNL